uniref:Histone-lysine N-methyltransferase MLL5 n=1 Tax=Ascaris suum TaxID=6253 RepID=F1KQ14_ASCSU
MMKKKKEARRYPTYEDHNYGDLSRSTNSSRANEENSETFPVIAGLASYFGEDEVDDQTTLQQRNAPVAEPSPISYRGPIRETYYRQSEQNASGYSYGSQSQTTYRITQNPGTNLVTIGGRTYVRQTTSNASQGYRSAARDNYSGGSTIGGASYAIGAYPGTRRMSSGVSQLKRALRPSGIAMGHSGMRIGVVSNASPTKQLPSAYTSPVSAANIVADPMRVANDNAPAPFIVPARGSKPTFRSKAQNGRGRSKPEQHDDLLESSVNVYKMSASPRKIATFGTALAVRQKSPTRLHQQLAAPYSSPPKSDYMMAGQVESGRAPQSETTDIHYHGTVENEPHVNVTTIDASAEQTAVAANHRGGEISRAVESPVTCIVESAHREAVRRASESAPLGHQPCDYKQFLDGQQQQQQHIATPRGRGRPPRMRSSLSANHGAAGQVGSNLQHMRGTRTRHSPSRSPSKTHSQSPYHGNRGVRQVPTSPGHVAGVFSHSAVLSPPRIRIRSRQHVVQQQEEFMLLQQQQAQPSRNLIPTMPQPISLPPSEGASEHFQPEQSQLSSPEQQMPPSVPQPVEMSGNYHSSAVSPSQLQSAIPLEGLSFEPSTASPGHVEIASHLGHLQAYVNEELSSGDELLLSQIPGVQDSQFIASRQPMPAGRSSTSAAEEENSFTEDLTEEKGTEEEGCDERSIVENLSGASSLKDSSEESWDEDYTTRCYCGLDHNDEFMIQCDTCKVWQHVKCMGMDRKHIPKVYKCEQCQPRPMKLTKTEAREMQMKALAKLRKEKERRQQRKAKRRDERVKKRMQKKAEKKPVAKKQLNATDQFQQTNTYDYSRAVMAFSRRHEDTCDPPKMDSVKNNEGLAVMFVTQVVRGLVSLRSFSVSEPVVYVCGRVSLPNECPGREKPGSMVPFVALYSELYLDGESESTPICIDMRKSGSVARYARRSCHPNVKLQHFFIGGKIHFVAVATEKVERGDEITFPFDNDYALSTEKLVCACCSQLEEDEGIYPATTSEEAYVCPIKVLNHDLARRERQSTPLESVPKKVMGKTVNANNSNKSKHVAKKVGVSVAKMLHKKAIQRVRKAKGMQKTNGKGCPPTASVKTTNTHSARGRPPLRTAGGVSHTARNSKTELKTAVPEVKIQPVQHTPVASTDEEGSTRKNILPSKVANRKSMIGPQKQNMPNIGSKKVTTSTSITAQRKKKGTIKLKRRMRKPSTRNTEEKTTRKDNTNEEDTKAIQEINNTATIEESKEEKGASDADVLRKKQIRSTMAVTATAQKMANSDLSQSAISVKNEEGEVSTENSEMKLSERGVKAENEKDEVIARVTRSSTIQQHKDIAAEQKMKSQKDKNAEDKKSAADTKEAAELKREIEKKTGTNTEMIERKDQMNDGSGEKKEVDGKKTNEKKEIDTKKSAKGKRKRAEEDGESGETKKKDNEKVVAKKSHHAKDGKVPMQEMNYMLPEDRNKAVSREERKLQQQIALMERMQANEKRKEDKRQHIVESPQQHNITSPSLKQPLTSSASIEHKEEIEKNEHNKEDISTKKRISRTSMRASESKASVDDKRSRTSSGGSAKRTSTAVTKNAEKQHEPAKVKKEESEKMQEDGIKVKESTTTPSESLSPTGVHISPPPRKRWASSAATNIANDGVNNAAAGSIGLSSASTNTLPTPSPISGKKAWLLQRAQQTQETANEERNEACTGLEAVHTNGTSQKTSVPPAKKKRNTTDPEKGRTKLNDGCQPESGNISHEDAAMLLTQMATDGVQSETKVLIPCVTATSSVQRPLVSPSGDGLDIRAQIGKLAAADVASGMREFSLSTLVSSGLPVVASTSSANGDPNNVVPPPVVNTRPPKKKMSLDEYRKRRATSHEKIEDRPVVTAAVGSEATQQTVAPHSFIPTINTNEISRRASLRLGAIPDPAQLKVVPTASLDDLKERIYGKRTPASSSHEGTSPSLGIGTFTRKFSGASKTPPESEMNLQDGRVSAVIPPPRTPPPPPPPLPPTKTVTLEAREARMSLEERMRLVLGCGTEVETNQNTFSGSTPPPPPPPPLLTSDRGEPRRSRPPVSVATVSSTSNVISSRGRTPPPPRAAAALSSTQSTRTRR